MADLSITAASVVVGSGASMAHGTAGATITAGQQVYLDAADNKLKLADTDSATAGVRAAIGTALHASLNGQPLAYATRGPVTIGATLIAGDAYYLSGTAGGICPAADLATGDYTLLIGIANSTTELELVYEFPNVVRA